MNNTKILIPGWAIGDNSFGVGKSYMEFLSQFGTVMVTPPTKEMFDWVDLVVLPGGKDTSSTRYGEIPSFFNSDADLYKEWFLDFNLQRYIEAGKAIFGICLGLQQLQVFFGGSLEQNVAHPYSEERNELAHTVELTPEFKYLASSANRIVRLDSKTQKFKVNSLHHQGVYEEKLADGFKAIALADDSCVEAMIHKDMPIAAVQYHPEEVYDTLSTYLITTILERKKNTKTKEIAVNLNEA